MQMVAAPNDAVQRIYQGILCCQNATQFYGTRMNTISFNPVRRVRYTGYSTLCTPGYGISPKSGNYGRKLIYTSKVKCGICCVNRHKIHSHTINCCGDLVFQILTKLDERVNKQGKF